LFKLLACQHIGSQNVQFYFGDEHCHGLTWIVAMLSLLALVLSFGTVFILGRKLTASERLDRNKFIYKLSKRFQPKHWYWEFVLFLRRIVIAYFAVGVPETTVYKLVFLFVMMAFVWIQWNTRPFLTAEANQLEFILLCLLPVVIMAPNISGTDEASVILSILVLFPIPILLFFMWRTASIEWSQVTAEHVEKEIDITAHARVASNSGNVPSTLEMQTNAGSTNGQTPHTPGQMAVPMKMTEGGDSDEVVSDAESDIQLEISNILNIVEMVYEGDRQETETKKTVSVDDDDVYSY